MLDDYSFSGVTPYYTYELESAKEMKNSSGESSAPIKR